MNTTNVTTAPRIESLLAAAHRDYAVLCERHGTLLRGGIARNNLPNELMMMAFALLGEHGRGRLIGQVEEHWVMLQSKGLTQGAIENASTAELRLLAHALPFTGTIEDIWQRLANATDVSTPPPGLLHCQTKVQGLWGHVTRLHFAAQDVRHVLIMPDQVFGLQSALEVAQADESLIGSFAFPIDNGAITMLLLHRDGGVFRHVVQVMVEKW